MMDDDACVSCKRPPPADVVDEVEALTSHGERANTVKRHAAEQEEGEKRNWITPSFASGCEKAASQIAFVLRSPLKKSSPETRNYHNSLL